MQRATLPEHIGPFRVQRPIAAGGMSEVFEVRDPATGDPLALKLLYQAGAAVKRFHREYEALTRLNHPNVVRVYHYGTHRGQPWLTMELLDGVALQVWVKQAGRPGAPQRFEQVARVGARVADALGYIHDRGLIHRDLKSANVVVLADGRVKLLDFGTAHVVDAVDRITKKGEFVGTFEYASPEQISGNALDGRSDLYSLGVLLYRLATGRRPFDSDDHRTLIDLHLRATPKPPIDVVPSLPRAFNDLVMSLLAKKPDDRPAHASTLRAALEDMVAAPTTTAHQPVVRTDRAVGREEAHRHLIDRMVSDRRPRALIVRGPLGAGRRQFARGIAAHLDGQGWTTRTVTLGRDGDAAEFVRALLHSAQRARTPNDEVGDATVALQQVLSRPGPLTDTTRKGLTFGVSRLAEALGPLEEPSLILLESLHSASAAAIDVITAAHRGLTTSAAEIVLLATASDDPTGWWLAALPDIAACELPPLTVGEVAQVAGTMLHRRPPPMSLARKLHNATGGQPRYLADVLEGLIASQRVVAAPDGARLSWGDAEATIPVSARASAEIDQALSALAADHRRTLETVAHASGPLPAAVIASASGFDIATTRAYLTNLARDGWTHQRGALVSIAHPLAARLVVEATHPCRRRSIERGLAAEVKENDEYTLQEVLLLLAGGRPCDGAPSGLRRAEELEGAGRVAEAAEALDAIVERMPAMRALPAELRARIYLAHARCLLQVRPTDTAITSALVLARTLTTDVGVSLEAQRLAARHEMILGRVPRSRDALVDAFRRASTTEGEADLSERIAVDLGLLSVAAGEPRSARDWFERARELAVADGNARAVAHAEAGLAYVVLRSGELDRALTLGRAAMAALEHAEDRPAAWFAAAVTADALRIQGRFSEALRMIHQRLGPARDGQISATYLRLLLVAARCEADLHRLGSAQEMIEEIDANLRANEHLDLQLEAGLTRGLLLLGGGHAAEARALLADVYQRARAANLGAFAERGRSLTAEALWALGEREEAGDVAEGAWLGLMGTGDLVALGDACTSWTHAVGARVDPQLIFQPVSDMITREGASLLQMELVLAQHQWARTRRDEPGARGALREGRQLLNRLASRQDDTEQSALRVHPWARRLREGGR